MGLRDAAKAAILAAMRADPPRKPIVLASDHSQTVTHVTLFEAVASKPRSMDPDDVEEWLAKDDDPQVIELTADGPAENGTISFNAGAITFSLD